MTDRQHDRGAERPFFDAAGVGLDARASDGADTAGGPELKCNGCAWGLVCERRDECAHRIPSDHFRAACRNGLPSLDDGRRGYRLFACTPGRFEHFHPFPAADLV